MEKFLYQILTVFFVGLITWFFSRSKQTLELKAKEIENDKSQLDFYKSLLDDAGIRINQCLDIIKIQDGKILERDKKIDLLLIEIENLTHEIRKYKQLNGKAE
ncbi:hypothetical protein K5L04_09325 [Flavobacterium psychrophilum]|uniref:hypothetical protein n=1 Tax=Flavobacterium psychrophilum TaxID=96345 RepID=UPI000B7C2A2B|nr:hypothetical protein [Flavobacterium psychrophilum]MCB6097906.1 hypothetical protein [Flavobacterium psychrophilum]MCB6230858.1 hypothetical protein [Flavobacterium psychrophilum]MEB3380589.1 hypothetical protein [Flavobacterium psychrophilum]QZK99898.1 hypothetical protein K5L04_09325 [Flavobacterium psychrophilum]SNA88034.1 conserved hypothetical protein [Flavobacterium psychrophilum]